MTMGRLQSIQILRFVAAALVVLVHSYPPAAIGAIGVDIFFVISGFIITKAARRASPSAFIRDRIRRIYPLYYLASLPYLLSAISSGRLTFTMAFVSATLWPVIGSMQRPLLSVGWTLSFEMLFYCMTALTIWRPTMARWLLAGYGVAALGALLTGNALLSFVGSPMILEFLFGVAIARGVSGNLRTGYVACAAALVMIAMQIANASVVYEVDKAAAFGSLRPFLWGVPSALLVWGALRLEPLFRGRISETLAYLGDASYSIYLVHFWAIVFFLTFFAWPVAALLAIVLGVGIHRYIEKPLLRLLKTDWRRATPLPA